MKKIFLFVLAAAFLFSAAEVFAQGDPRGRGGRFNRPQAEGVRVSPGNTHSMRSYGAGRKWTRTQPKTAVRQLPKVSPPGGAQTRVKEFERPELDAPDISLMPSKISGEVNLGKKTAAQQDQADKKPGLAAGAKKEDSSAPVSKTEVTAAQQDQAAALKQAQDMARQMGVDLPPDVQQMMSGTAASGAAGMPAGMPQIPGMPAGAMPNMPAGMPDISQLMKSGAAQ